MSQKQERRRRQELRSQGISTLKPAKVPNRMHPTALKWFMEEQKKLQSPVKPRRQTRSQKLMADG